MTTADRRILRLALPALGTLAAEPLYRLVDTAIVGRLGVEELGGLAVAVAILALVVAGSNFLAYGTTEQVANRVGAGATRDAADVGVQALWLAIVLGVVAVPVLITFARPFCALLGADGRVLDLGTVYLRISALGVPFVLVGLAAQGVMRGVSDYDTPLRILIVANAVNLVVELVLVLGLDLGVAGAAWSTVLAQTGAGIAFLVLVAPRLAPSSDLRPHWPRMRPLVAAGRHLLLRVGSMLVVFSGSTAVAARIDDVTLAAHQITISMFFFVALSLDALAIPAQTLVAETLGGGAPAEAAEITRRVVRLSVWIAVALAAALAAASPLVARLFSSDAAAVGRATTGLFLLAVLLVPGAIAFAYDGALIGAGDYRFLGRAAFGYLLAVAPIAAAVLTVPELGIAGIWIGLIVWMVVRAVVNHLRARTIMLR